MGIGAGSPGHLTQAAITALRAADLILIPTKGEEKADLADLRRAICAEAVPGARLVEVAIPARDAAHPSYLAGVEDWHDAVARAWGAALAAHPGARRAAVMVWGDPSLYDSSLRIAARLPVTVRVIPGITAVQALTAAHAIPLNDLGAPVLFTTGRRLREAGWPRGVDRLVVLLDGGCAFRGLPPEGIRIWWGAYLGMAGELLDHGPLAEAGPRIETARARARAERGWIMDVYLLARDPGPA